MNKFDENEIIGEVPMTYKDYLYIIIGAVIAVGVVWTLAQIFVGWN